MDPNAFEQALDLVSKVLIKTRYTKQK